MLSSPRSFGFPPILFDGDFALFAQHVKMIQCHRSFACKKCHAKFDGQLSEVAFANGPSSVYVGIDSGWAYVCDPLPHNHDQDAHLCPRCTVTEYPEAAAAVGAAWAKALRGLVEEFANVQIEVTDQGATVDAKLLSEPNKRYRADNVSWLEATPDAVASWTRRGLGLE